MDRTIQAIILERNRWDIRPRTASFATSGLWLVRKSPSYIIRFPSAIRVSRILSILTSCPEALLYDPDILLRLSF